MTFERSGLQAFVPRGDDIRATARTLVELADANGIAQTSIQASNDGFYITDELADLLYDEGKPEPEDAPADSAPKKKRK